MAVCAAIVGKDVSIYHYPLPVRNITSTFLKILQNSPKFFCCVNPDEELAFQYKVLSSLDIIEEKLNPTNKSASDNRELYLGQLYSLETCKMYPFLNPCLCPIWRSRFLTLLFSYGYVTNTKIKFIIVVDSTNMALRDNEIRSVSIVGLL